jgi:broad specificity phosphatase PhoE
MAATWPEALFLVRHGESSGNVARDEAEATGLEIIDIDERDVDVPLSDLGRRQAQALGRWLARQAEDERPTTILSSPYMRAQQTADEALAAADHERGDVEWLLDERLREREFGVLDRLTRPGIAAREPHQAELRAFLGKFYHRPPGGESWADVGLRVRGVLDTLRLDLAGERVLISTHQVVVLMFRYVLEAMTEAEVLAISSEEPVAHCSVTSYVFDPSVGRRGGMALQAYNVVEPLVEEDEPVTTYEDAPAAAAG